MPRFLTVNVCLLCVSVQYRGNVALPISECVDAVGELAGVQWGSQDVVVKVSGLYRVSRLFEVARECRAVS